MIVIDDLLSDFKELKDYACNAEFKVEQNDADGAYYPAIHLDIPQKFKDSFIAKIEEVKGFKIKPKMIFLRANAEGQKEPYQAHNDLNMSDYTCILYMTEVGGTAFVEHINTGVNKNDESFYNTWIKDCNNYDAWKINDYCNMQENRALFFNAEMMHRGEPVEGYGNGKDTRMIMVCFYDRADY